MELYVEKDTAGQYGLIDTFINETVSLNTKTTYTQDITAVFKGFTNDFAIQASPNNIKLLGYFGYTEQYQPASIIKRAKLFLDGSLYKEGIITLKNTSWINGSPSLFSIEFSDGQKNLTEILGEDTLAMLNDGSGDIAWTTKNIQNGLQSIQTASGGVRWFIPLVSVDRIFSISGSDEAIQTDNIYYKSDKSITSEDVLLPTEIRPAMFLEDILKKINSKYDIKIDPTPYLPSTYTQLTDLATMCTKEIAIQSVKVPVTVDGWSYDKFLEERFDIIPKPLIGGFELNYLGYGGGGHHDATFDMIIALCKVVPTIITFPYHRVNPTSFVDTGSIKNLEVWEIFPDGEKKKKLNYQITGGGENDNAYLRIRIGLDVFTPEGSSSPSTFIKPLIAVFVSESLTNWKYTYFAFNWWKESVIKHQKNNTRPPSVSTSVNLFESLSEMKLIDFVKSIYTMFGYKKFKTKVLNDFYYTPKTTPDGTHSELRGINDLTPYADLSKLTKATNTKYDGYNLKHATSEYLSNVNFLSVNGIEYGQMKFPLTGKPKTEFKIETKFTAPAFAQILSDADALHYTFYPFGGDPKLNDSETRFVYEPNIKEFPIFYYNGVNNISTPYAFVDTDLKVLKSINKYHKISHKSNRIFTGADNYITSLFNTLVGIDYVDQNTLYVQDFKTYIEDTLSGKKLIHTIDLALTSIAIQEFEDSDEIIIKETKYTVLESNIGLTDGKTKLTLLNK